MGYYISQSLFPPPNIIALGHWDNKIIDFITILFIFHAANVLKRITKNQAAESKCEIIRPKRSLVYIP